MAHSDRSRTRFDIGFPSSICVDAWGTGDSDDADHNISSEQVKPGIRSPSAKVGFLHAALTGTHIGTSSGFDSRTPKNEVCRAILGYRAATWPTSQTAARPAQTRGDCRWAGDAS